MRNTVLLDPKRIAIVLTPDPEELGRTIKRLRLANDLSAQQVARHCGVVKNTVYNWERHGNIGVIELVKLLSLVEVQVQIT